jgi:hypothetical protein
MGACGDPNRDIRTCTPSDPFHYSGPTHLQAQAPTCIQERYGMLGVGQYPSNYTAGKNYGNGYGTMLPPGFNSPANQQCLQQYQAIQNQIQEGVRANATAWQNKLNREANTARSIAEQAKRNSIAAAQAAKNNVTSIVQDAGSSAGGSPDLIACEGNSNQPEFSRSALCVAYRRAFVPMYLKDRSAKGIEAARQAGAAAVYPPPPPAPKPNTPVKEKVTPTAPKTPAARPSSKATRRPKRVSSASSGPEPEDAGIAIANAVAASNAAAAAARTPVAPVKGAPAAPKPVTRQVYCGYGCIIRS